MAHPHPPGRSIVEPPWPAADAPVNLDDHVTVARADRHVCRYLLVLVDVAAAAIAAPTDR